MEPKELLLQKIFEKFVLYREEINESNPRAKSFEEDRIQELKDLTDNYLKRLSVEQLEGLLLVESFPVPDEIRKKINDIPNFERVIRFLEIRSSIKAAHEEGLFEALEHATGLLTFDD